MIGQPKLIIFFALCVFLARAEAQPAPDHLLTFNLYVKGLTWNDTFMDDTNPVYIEIKDVVQKSFVELGGSLRTLKLAQNHGCIHIFIEWAATQPEQILSIMQDLKNSSFTLGSQPVSVYTQSCPAFDFDPDTDIVKKDPECPSLPKDSVGGCVQACDDSDPKMACSEGYRCCSNGCGKVCVRVGYKVKVAVEVIVDMAWDKNILSSNLSKSKEIERELDRVMGDVFIAEKNPFYNGSSLLYISPKTYGNTTYTAVWMDMFLEEDVPNERLLILGYQLERRSLDNLEGKPDILFVESRDHSMNSPKLCGSVECDGICKTGFSAGDFCSCWPGQYGSGCDEFDCSEDKTDVSATKNFCKNKGTCMMEFGKDGYEYKCDCPSGYYGDVCEMNVCKMTVKACGDHGQCVGLLEQAQLCQCDSGWGGLFCDKQLKEPEKLTPCEIERRLTLFVHEQVTGQAKRSPRLSTLMSVLLNRIESPVYTVPYCTVPGVNSTSPPGQYYSACDYDSTTGQPLSCVCLDEFRRSTNRVYLAEDDCGVRVSEKVELDITLDESWDPQLADDKSDEFFKLKTVIENEVDEKMAEYRVRGYQRSNVVSFYEAFPDSDDNVPRKKRQISSTVGVSIELIFTGPVPVDDLIKLQSVLETDGLSSFGLESIEFGGEEKDDVTGKEYTICGAQKCESGSLCVERMDGNKFCACPVGKSGPTCSINDPDKDIDPECPSLPKNSVGVCVQACNDSDLNLACSEGYRCCSNGCGKVCVRVGYKVKVAIEVTVDMEWDRNILSSNASKSKEIERELDRVMRDVFIAENNPFYNGSSLAYISSKTYGNTTYTSVWMDMFLEEDVPNERLRILGYQLEKRSLYNLEGNPDILLIESRDHSMNSPKFCGSVECDGICKTGFSAGDFCSCWPGQYGSSCDEFDCRHDTTDVIPTNHFCENSGTCMFGIDGNEYTCSCVAGYYGDVCEMNVCKMTVKACGDHGQCVGLLEQAQLCQCDSGWGGLFCDKELKEPEELTPCEIERRLTLFVHEQVTGQAKRTSRLSTLMSVLLSRIESPVYTVPYCTVPGVNSTSPPGQYYSACDYDSTTGQPLSCVCLDQFRSATNRVYLAEDDCGDPATGFPMTEFFYFYSPKNASDDAIDTELKIQIKKLLATMDGELSFYIRTPVGNGCVAVTIHWMTKTQPKVKVIDLLKNSDVQVNGEKLRLSKDFCGVEVGPSEKVSLDITLDESWDPQLGDDKSDEFSKLKTIIENAVDEKMAEYRVRGFQRSNVVSFYEAFPDSDDNVPRKKRQISSTVGVSIELMFTGPVPVDDLIKLQSVLENDGLSDFGLDSIEFGKIEKDEVTGKEYTICGAQICEYGSLCVERMDGNKFCACPGGKSGPTCGISNPTSSWKYKETFYVSVSNTSDPIALSAVLDELVIKALSTLGGQRNLLTGNSSGGNCLVVVVEWSSKTQTSKTVVSVLQQAGNLGDGVVLNVSEQGCSVPPLDTCPKLGNNETKMVMNCYSQCKTDEDCDDKDESLCCDVGCGGKTCIEVGFLERITANVTVNTPWMPDLANEESATFGIFALGIERELSNRMVQDGVASFQRLRVLSFYPVSTALSTTSRRKRQISDLLGVSIEFRFSGPVPVASLLKLQADLKTNGVPMDGQTLTLKSVHFGQLAMDTDGSGAYISCGVQRCETGSLCVERLGGFLLCACFGGRTGTDCEISDVTTKSSSTTVFPTTTAITTTKVTPPALDICPKLTTNETKMLMNCHSPCKTDEDCDDNDESLCCDVGCGGKTCIEVGFLERITANVTVDTPWMPDLGIEGSLAFGIYVLGIERELNNKMVQDGVVGFQRARVLFFYPVSASVSTSRRKRQTSDLLGVSIEFRFSGPVPVASLLTLQADLETNGFSMDGQTLTLQSVQFGQLAVDAGSSGSYISCGVQRCEFGSLCVERVGGFLSCACSGGRTGTDCEIHDIPTTSASTTPLPSTSPVETSTTTSKVTSPVETSTTTSKVTSPAETSTTTSKVTSPAETSTTTSKVTSPAETSTTTSKVTSPAETSTTTSKVTSPAETSTTTSKVTSPAETSTTTSKVTSPAETSTTTSKVTSPAETSTTTSKVTSPAETSTTTSKVTSPAETSTTTSKVTSPAETSTTTSKVTSPAETSTTTSKVTSPAETSTTTSKVTSPAETPTTTSKVTSPAETPTTTSKVTPPAETSTATPPTETSTDSTASKDLPSTEQPTVTTTMAITTTTVTPTVNLCGLPPKTNELCRGNSPRYFYNATSMVCEMLHSTYCSGGFPTVDKCCDACNNKGRCQPGMCPPVGPGPAISCTDECTTDSSCPGTQICCSNGCAKTCVQPHVTMPTDCMQRKVAAVRRESLAMSKPGHLSFQIDIPECDATGYYSKLQCDTGFGLCWCVTPNGNYINNTITRGMASCEALTEAEMAQADEMKMVPSTDNIEVCPQGVRAYYCSTSLCEKPCKKYPQARCLINPCGGCEVEFFTYPNVQKVKCSEGLSKCEMEQMKAESSLQERKINAERKMMSHSENNMKRMDQDDSKDWSAICQLPPDSGPCEGWGLQWFYNSTMGTCSQFVYGMCQGNENRFSSAAECYKTCNATLDPCMRKTCPQGQRCRHNYSEECHTTGQSCEVTAVCQAVSNTTYATGVYVPRCEADGSYRYKQCHGGYCWCVNSEGEVTSGLTTQATDLQCGNSGYIPTGAAILFETCSNGLQPNISCVRDACIHQVCPGSSDATCKVDFCSDNCAVAFVDGENEEVNCEGNKCDVFTFDADDSSNCSAQLECKNGGVRYCPESVCHSAESSCAKNPCAVCTVDQCTCQPYFVNAITNERVTQEQCRFISLGVCQAKTCKLLTRRSEAKLSGEAVNSSSLPLPQCDKEGGFEPKQCNGEDCVCVDELGGQVGEPSSGSCQEIDDIVQVVVVFTFRGNLSDLATPEIIQELKSAILKKLEESGINPLNVRFGEPYEGSIKLDVEIVENPDSPQNLALSRNAIQQLVNSDDFSVTAGGKTFDLDPEETIVTPRTASQVGSGVTSTPVPPGPSSSPASSDVSGLSKTDEIIIGSVAGGVGLLILIILIYCCCSSQRKQDSEPGRITDSAYMEPRKATMRRDVNYQKPNLYV